MQYKTIILELLRQRRSLHERLRKSDTLLETLNEQALRLRERHLEWLAVCDRESYHLIEFPVTSVRRHGGTSTTRLSSALAMYGGAVGLRRRFAARSVDRSDVHS